MSKNLCHGPWSTEKEKNLERTAVAYDSLFPKEKLGGRARVFILRQSTNLEAILDS